MQESSKGLTNTMDHKHQEEKSAFKIVPRTGNSRKTSNSSDKRDSGYITDNSPANFVNNNVYFTFDNPDLLSDHAHATIPDNEDEEVEMVLNSPTLPPQSKPIPIHRPPAPVPRTEMEPSQENDYPRDLPRVQSLNDVFIHRRPRYSHHFRPIPPGRTIGTQTPNPHSQCISEAAGCVSESRFHPYHTPIARGTAYVRLRHQSDGDDPFDDPSPNLPDIIPVPRDRSVSLPNVHQREVEVGRELRRISDEFHLHYSSERRSRRHTLSEHQPASFPGTTAFNFQNWWEQLRQLFASSPMITPDTDLLPLNMDNVHPQK